MPNDINRLTTNEILADEARLYSYVNTSLNVHSLLTQVKWTPKSNGERDVYSNDKKMAEHLFEQHD